MFTFGETIDEKWGNMAVWETLHIYSSLVGKSIKIKVKVGDRSAIEYQFGYLLNTKLKA